MLFLLLWCLFGEGAESFHRGRAQPSQIGQQTALDSTANLVERHWLGVVNVLQHTTAYSRRASYHGPAKAIPVLLNKEDALFKSMATRMCLGS